ncbi:MAG TPA: hypothetical protein VJB63_03150, partial [Patescibacteria group bacterium]|nr:hypothetical protein [Patescibacteria group bacterium]
MSEQIATEIHKKSTTTKEKHTPKNYTSLLKKGAVITQAALLSLSLSQTNVDVNAQINDKPVDIEQNATTREQEPSEEDWRFQINQLLQTKPFKILEYADKIGQFKWSEEVVLKAIAIKTPQPGFNFNLERAVALLENAEKLHGYTQTVINDVREATENIGSFNCVVLLREADHLSDYSWSSNLLQNLVATSSINMQEFIEHIDNIKNYKWTESTLKKMIEESHNNFNLYITSALTNLFTCSTPETKNIPWFKELIKEEAIWTADNHPEVIIRNSQSLDVLDNIFAEVVIIKALTIMENTGSLSSSTNFNNCMGYLTIFDFAEPFIKRAVDRLKNENPRIIFDHLNILPAYEWFDNMFNDAIRNDPVSALEYYRSFDPGTVAVQ